MNADTSTMTTVGAGSLLEGINMPSKPERAAAVPPRADRPFIPPILKDNRLTRWSSGHKRASWTILAALFLALVVGLYLLLRPTPQPDYATAPMDELLDYTLLTDDFNKLPIERRQELLRELIDRFSKMSADDSVGMAGWAAAIQGDLRDQIMKNASLLAIDTFDKVAGDYKSVPEPEREGFIDKSIVDMMKLMESMSPMGPRNISDEKRLEEARAQAKRDQEMMRSDSPPSSGQLGQMADFMKNGMGKFASPQTQQRSQQLMRDMTRRLRGQDLVTGKPKP